MELKMEEGYLTAKRKKERINNKNTTPLPQKTALELFNFGIEEKPGNQHPWILSRERCILNIVKKRHLYDFADIGVNDMYYTKKIRSFTDGAVYAVDIFFPDDGLIKDGIICVNAVSKLPENGLDCLIMMDVLEYIEDDKGFLNEAVGKLRENGVLLITVPAWQFLFSAHDIRSRHLRRYDKKRLLALLDQKNIRIKRCHYFYAILFFSRLLGMARNKNYTGNDIKWKYPENHFITILIRLILDIDFAISTILSKLFIQLPGLSILAVCRKTK
jgi:SAM-dependent methyltransferase